MPKINPYKLAGAALALGALLSGVIEWRAPSFQASPLIQKTAATALNALTPAAGTPDVSPTISIALHRALYDFKMVSVETGAGILDVKGKMFFEQDDVCDAWTTDHRYTTEYYYPERSAVRNTNHYSSWEAKTGDQFQFSSDRQENDQVIERLRGSTTQKPDGSASADYTKPDALSYPLPKGYFLPTAHTLEVIRRARNGEHFFSAVMFDGSDADGPVETSIFIGKKLSATETAALSAGKPKVDSSLLAAQGWHVRMAVFPLKDTQAATAAYEMDMTLHENGIISHALIDYKTFKIEQSLTALEKVAATDCAHTP